MKPNITIPEAVRGMLAIVKRLCDAYPHKSFTLDGRLVGDIGEVLVEESYDLKLFDDLRKHHDAHTPDGRRVQIKAAQGDMYQMYAYAQRYECRDVVLMYPHHAGLGPGCGVRRTYAVRRDDGAGTGRVRIATVDLTDLRTVPAQIKAVVGA